MPKTIPSDVQTVMEQEANFPILLIKIELDDITLYFNNTTEDVNFPTTDGQTYVAWGFKHNPIVTTLSLETDRFQVEFDNTDLTFSTDYVKNYKFQNRRLTIYKVMESKLAVQANAATLFSGKMGAPKSFDKKGDLKTMVMVLSDFETLRAEFPPRKLSSPCEWAFDGDRCRNPELVVNGNQQRDDSWKAFGVPTSEEQSTDFTHTGKYSRKVVNDGADQGIQTDDGEEFSVTDGDSVLASAWIYHGLIGDYELTLLDDTTVMDSVTVTVTPTGAWFNITGMLVADATTTDARIAVSRVTASVTSFYVDDISVTQRYFKDLSGNQNQGNPADVPVFVADSDGNADGALTFDGTSQQVIVPDNSVLNFGTATDFSILLKVKGNTETTFKGLIRKGDPHTGTQDGYALSFRGDRSPQEIQFKMGDGAAAVTISEDYDLDDGNWHTTGITADRSGLGILYADGLPLKSSSISALGNIDVAEDLSIGTYNPGNRFFDGYMMYGVIYNRVLTPTEMLDAETTGTIPTDYVAYWPLSQDKFVVAPELKDELNGAAESGSSTVKIIDTANRGEADNYWKNGVIEFTSGNNTGERREVKDFTNSTAAIDIIIPLPHTPGVGDTYIIERGCDKNARTCQTKFDNWINFGAFTTLPSGGQ
jgi:hypothetical protein